jgi:hypothetical protein
LYWIRIIEETVDVVYWNVEGPYTVISGCGNGIRGRMNVLSKNRSVETLFEYLQPD